MWPQLWSFFIRKASKIIFFKLLFHAAWKKTSSDLSMVSPSWISSLLLPLIALLGFFRFILLGRKKSSASFFHSCAGLLWNLHSSTGKCKRDLLWWVFFSFPPKECILIPLSLLVGRFFVCVQNPVRLETAEERNETKWYLSIIVVSNNLSIFNPVKRPQKSGFGF